MWVVSLWCDEAGDDTMSSMKRQPILVVGAFDTKEQDLEFICEEIERRGYRTVTIDTSVLSDPKRAVDISASQVAEAGGEALTTLRRRNDRGLAIGVMQAGVRRWARVLYSREPPICAMIGLGGSAGTVISTAGMRELPLGVPKLVISTLASGETGSYLREKDIVMFPSIVDICGVNRISAGVYARAVGALIGMLESPPPSVELKPVVSASMFGNTTRVVQRCKSSIEARAELEVLVFHATGTGGRSMETLIREGLISGVLDITTTELADEVVGGVMSAGPDRLSAAAEKGIPQVVVPGCVDMVNFWQVETVPDRYRNRRLYSWTADVTLMRTEPEENATIGRMIAERVNSANGPVSVMLPLQGLSLLDAPGKEFWWPEADNALFDAVRQTLSDRVNLVEVDCNINDDEFADAVTEEFISVMQRR